MAIPQPNISTAPQGTQSITGDTNVLLQELISLLRGNVVSGQPQSPTVQDTTTKDKKQEPVVTKIDNSTKYDDGVIDRSLIPLLTAPELAATDSELLQAARQQAKAEGGSPRTIHLRTKRYFERAKGDKARRIEGQRRRDDFARRKKERGVLTDEYGRARGGGRGSLFPTYKTPEMMSDKELEKHIEELDKKEAAITKRNGEIKDKVYMSKRPPVLEGEVGRNLLTAAKLIGLRAGRTGVELENFVEELITVPSNVTTVAKKVGETNPEILGRHSGMETEQDI